MSRNYYNASTDMTVIIKADRSFAMLGNNPDSVTDPVLWDLADDILPEGWVRTI